MNDQTGNNSITPGGQPDADVDNIIAILDGYTQSDGSRLKIDVVEGNGEVLSRQYHHGRCDVGSPWACGTPFDVLEEEKNMHSNFTCTAEEALNKLKSGNARYLAAEKSEGDISPSIRLKTCNEGQKPYAIVVTCADSRVIPESIFSAGIGEIFVIRVAGNVIDKNQLGSVEYAAEHLGSPLVVVMGHTHCGAVGAAMGADPEGYVKFITDEIKKAIGGEKDDYAACCLNVRNSVKVITDSLKIQDAEGKDLQVCGAVYHIEDGKVEFL